MMPRRVAKPEREFLTTGEVAAITRSRPETVVNHWIRGGELLAVNFARKGATRPRFRIRREDLKSFLRRRSTLPQVKPASRRRRGDEATRG